MNSSSIFAFKSFSLAVIYLTQFSGFKLVSDVPKNGFFYLKIDFFFYSVYIKFSYFDLIPVDTNGTMSHPIHIHGTLFYVMELGTARDRANGRHREFPSARPFTIKKDTVVVPSNGYARVRFNATNPGAKKYIKTVSLF